jgi:hypothetical protein
LSQAAQPAGSLSSERENHMSQLTSKAEAIVCCALVASTVVLAFVYFTIPNITGFQALGIIFVWVALFVVIFILRTAERI